MLTDKGNVRSHYISKVHFRKFAIPSDIGKKNPKVGYLQKRFPKKEKPKSVKCIGVELGLYSDDLDEQDQFEKYFWFYENRYNSLLSSIRSGRLDNTTKLDVIMQLLTAHFRVKHYKSCRTKTSFGKLVDKAVKASFTRIFLSTFDKMQLQQELDEIKKSKWNAKIKNTRVDKMKLHFHQKAENFVKETLEVALITIKSVSAENQLFTSDFLVTIWSWNLGKNDETFLAISLAISPSELLFVYYNQKVKLTSEEFTKEDINIIQALTIDRAVDYVYFSRELPDRYFERIRKANQLKGAIGYQPITGTIRETELIIKPIYYNNLPKRVLPDFFEVKSNLASIWIKVQYQLRKSVFRKLVK